MKACLVVKGPETIFWLNVFFSCRAPFDDDDDEEEDDDDDDDDCDVD